MPDDSVRKFSEATKGMTGRQKIGYIWEYYKPQILMSAFVLVLLAIALDSFVINPAKKSFASVNFYKKIVSEDTLDTLQTDLTKSVVPENDRKEYAVFVNSHMTATEPQALSAQVTRFAGDMMSQKLDVFLLEPSVLVSEFLTAGYLRDMTTVLSEAQLKKYEHLLLYDSAGFCFGLRLDTSKYLDRLGLSGLELCVTVNSVRVAQARRIIDFLLKEEI